MPKTITLEGMVSFEEINKGSKSQHAAPMLQTYVEGVPDKKVHIEYGLDNPFQNETMHTFDGRYVQAEGIYYRGKFIADSIKEIKRPK